MLFVVWLGVFVSAKAPGQDLFPATKVEGAASEQTSSRFWDWGFQATTITQFAPSFTNPYEGPLSFRNNKSSQPATTFVSTLFLAARLWTGAWVSVQPEFSGGSGVGGGGGIAAYVNQDVLRVPSIGERPYLARVFLQQAIPLGARETQQAGERPARPEEKFLPGGDHLFGSPGGPRLEITFGKMALPDIFDASDFGGEAHHGLMNWALVNSGSWDFAADTRGYTWGFTLAYEGGPLALRAGTYAMPEVANGVNLDHDFRNAHAENVEVEWPFAPERQGVVRFLGFINHARMGDYDESLRIANGDTPDITATRQAGRVKYGFGLNAQRMVGRDLGIFTRAGWNDGKTETFAYTEIDRMGSLGFSQTGRPWNRPDDRLIGALIVSGLSGPHRRYLEAGGSGFQLGDGRLAYDPEIVVELDYAAQLTRGVSVGLDLQYVANPGFNHDRGPITVYGLRVHVHR